MSWLDIVGIVGGFIGGWGGAMVYYQRLCSLAETAKMLSLGLWRRRG